MNIITRKQARKQGLAQYHTGKQCCHGHTSPRFTSNGGCVQCSREKYANIRAKLIDEHGVDGANAILRNEWKKKAKQHRDKDTSQYRDYIREYMREYRKTPEGKEAIKRAHKKYHDKVKNEKISND